MAKSFNKFYLVSVLFFCIISFTSASLQLSSNTWIFNKTYNVNLPIIFNISNSDSFSYYNVSLFPNEYFSNFIINEIPAGASVSVNATIISNNNINTTIRLKSFYYTNVGLQNKTWHLNISSYTDSFSPCSLSIVKGDKVIFNNKLSNPITIKDVNNNIDVSTVPATSSYIMNFPSPITFRYIIYIVGFQLTPICSINSLDTTGLVNDPDKDFLINFNLKNNYESTTIDSNLLNNNFSMDFFEQKEGILTISNIGNKTAFNINLNADWMSFSPNNFNLNIGESKGIIFKINPLIFSTNDTNRSYSKIITISGNFNSKSLNTSIFIKHALFDSANSSRADIDYLIKEFCPQYPNSVLCNGSGQNIIYKYINNNSDTAISYNMTGKEMRDLWLYLFSLGDKIETNNNYQKEQVYNINNNTEAIDDKVLNVDSKLNSLQEEQINAKTNILFLIIVLLFIFVIAIVVLLIYLSKKIKKINELRRM